MSLVTVAYFPASNFAAHRVTYTRHVADIVTPVILESDKVSRIGNVTATQRVSEGCISELPILLQVSSNGRKDSY